jgi:hypothetical protein
MNEDMNTALAILRRLREAQDAESRAGFNYRQARGKAKDAAFDLYHAATRERREAEEAADLLLGRE